MSEQDPESMTVRGERDATAVHRAASVQSRISNVLAIGLMSVLGLGMLTWYYANAMTRQSRARAECTGLVDEPRPGRHAAAEPRQDRSAGFHLPRMTRHPRWRVTRRRPRRRSIP